MELTTSDEYVHPFGPMKHTWHSGSGIIVRSTAPLEFVEWVMVQRHFEQRGKHEGYIGGKLYEVHHVVPIVDNRTEYNDYNETNQPKGKLMNHVKNAVRSTKNFVANHKSAFAFVVGASIGIALNKTALREHDAFLKEHGLYEEFYLPEG